MDMTAYAQVSARSMWFLLFAGSGRVRVQDISDHFPL